MKFRWPFVLRSRYDGLTDDRNWYRQANAQHVKDAHELRGEIARLTRELQLLRDLSGATDERLRQGLSELLHVACAAKLSCEKMGIAI